VQKVPGHYIKAPGTGTATWTSGLIIRSKVFWLIVLGFLPNMEVTSALTVNFGPCTRDLGIENSHAAVLMSLWSAMMVIGKISFGTLADRFDHRTLYYAGLLLLSGALLLMLGQPGFPMLVIAIVMLGLPAGGSLPLAGAMIGRHDRAPLRCAGLWPRHGAVLPVHPPGRLRRAHRRMDTGHLRQL
jgi:MFS family permease